MYNNLITTLGYDKAVTTTLGNSPAAIGNRIAQTIISACMNDGANELNNYADTTGYSSVNTPMVAGFPTATDQGHATMGDPNRWQPLYINSLTAQNGIVEPSNLQKYVGPQWAPVTPFAMHSMSGPFSWSDLDPGPPPQLGRVGDAIYREQAVDMIRISNSLDPLQGPGAAMINISPSATGNRPRGRTLSLGYAANPLTGLPYADNRKARRPRASSGRVLGGRTAFGNAPRSLERDRQRRFR